MARYKILTDTEDEYCWDSEKDDLYSRALGAGSGSLLAYSLLQLTKFNPYLVLRSETDERPDWALTPKQEKARVAQMEGL